MRHNAELELLLVLRQQKPTEFENLPPETKLRVLQYEAGQRERELLHDEERKKTQADGSHAARRGQ